MSAFGYKQTCGEVCQGVRFTPESRHLKRDVRFSPEYVRYYPESGHKWLWRGMSAFDPGAREPKARTAHKQAGTRIIAIMVTMFAPAKSRTDELLDAGDSEGRAVWFRL